jgi:hypothetical protein
VARTKNLDAIHSARISAAMKRIDRNGHFSDDDIFVGQRIIETIGADKAFLGGYDYDKVRGVLPFTPALYVVFCPVCYRRATDKVFETLT